MTTCGTMPTSSTPSANLEYLSRARDRIKDGLGARRPWKLMFNIQYINCPRTLSEAISRFRTNTAFFRMNYVIIVLIVLFLGLLWHPISLIVLVILMALWLFLYFPLGHFKPHDRRSRVTRRAGGFDLCVLTVDLCHQQYLGGGVLLHASLRKIDDLYDEENTGLVSEPSSSSS